MRVHSRSKPTGLAAAFEAAVENKSQSKRWEIVDRFFRKAVEHKDKPTLSHIVWHLVDQRNVHDTERQDAASRRSDAFVAVIDYLGRRSWDQLGDNIRSPSKWLSRSIRNALSKTRPKGHDATGPEHKYPAARLPKPSDATLEYRDDLHTLTDRALRDHITTFEGGGIRSVHDDHLEIQHHLQSLDGKDLLNYVLGELSKDAADRKIARALADIRQTDHGCQTMQEMDLRIAFETGIAISTVTKRRRALEPKVRAILQGGHE